MRAIQGLDQQQNEELEKPGMWIWAALIVFGGGASVSFYMAFLAYSVNADGVYLFAAFGLFFVIPFIAFIIHLFQKRGILLKRMDEATLEAPETTRFTPHWVMMTILILFGIGILAAILIPRLFSGN